MKNFPIADWRIMKFEKSINPNKKYRVYIQNKKTNEIKHIDFGATGYDQYKDTTPLKLYSNDDHLDTNRRELFRKRFEGLYDKNVFNPTYFSWNFLW